MSGLGFLCFSLFVYGSNNLDNLRRSVLQVFVIVPSMLCASVATPEEVKSILAVASGKGGVGKSSASWQFVDWPWWISNGHWQNSCSMQNKMCLLPKVIPTLLQPQYQSQSMKCKYGSVIFLVCICIYIYIYILIYTHMCEGCTLKYSWILTPTTQVCGSVDRQLYVLYRGLREFGLYHAKIHGPQGAANRFTCLWPQRFESQSTPGGGGNLFLSQRCSLEIIFSQLIMRLVVSSRSFLSAHRTGEARPPR